MHTSEQNLSLLYSSTGFIIVREIINGKNLSLDKVAHLVLVYQHTNLLIQCAKTNEDITNSTGLGLRPNFHRRHSKLAFPNYGLILLLKVCNWLKVFKSWQPQKSKQNVIALICAMKICSEHFRLLFCHGHQESNRSQDFKKKKKINP